jgi:hypothetical protein
MIRQCLVNLAGFIVSTGARIEPMGSALSLIAKGIVMNGNMHILMKKAVLAAALVVGASGVARADDSSMNPLTGESYAYFNGGYDRPAIANSSFDNAPSAWRQSNPNGLPESVFQSYSAPGEAWHLNKPVFASAPTDPAFKQSHPNGLTESELQALSSEASAWQLRGGAGPEAVASEDHATIAQSATKEPLGERIANFFHIARSGIVQ